MDIAALTQPDPRDRSIEVALIEALEWDNVTSVWIASAWVKRSGLDLIEGPMAKLRKKKAKIRALIGVDQHGATVEALEQALNTFGSARIYHDKAKFRTFHPKLYVVQAPGKARIIVGSGNLTEGGLSTNYELAVQLDLALDDDGDKSLLNDFEEWFDRRWNHQKASKKLTQQLIKRLQSDPDVIVVEEALVPDPPGTSKSGDKKSGVFTESVKGLRGRRPKKKSRPDSDSSDAVTPFRPPNSNTVRVAAKDTVLVAGVPRDRLGQAGFNTTIAEEFFEVFESGETIRAASVDRKGTLGEMTERRLINPKSSNNNHRIEMRDPDVARAASKYKDQIRPVILVRKIGNGRFRYLYLYPGDTGYAAMKQKIKDGDSVGSSRSENTKRVYVRLKNVKAAWSTCPL